MIIHGIAPSGLLLSTLVPIPKNKNGHRCNYDNYRQIAISSILVKLFDIIVWKNRKIAYLPIYYSMVLRSSLQQYYAHPCC